MEIHGKETRVVPEKTPLRQNAGIPCIHLYSYIIKIYKTFTKPLDKLNDMWYNHIKQKEAATNRTRRNGGGTNGLIQ